MGAVAAPYGLYPRKCYGNRRHTAGCTSFPITVNNAGALYWGAPVALASGTINPIAASPTTTAGANNPVGVLNGVFWEDKAGPHWQPFLPANVITGLGGKKVVAMVNDDPDLWFMVQANGTLDLSHVGKNAALASVNTGNTATGRSTCVLDAASVAVGATLAVKIIRVLDPGAAFPDVLVQWNGGIHQYLNGFAV